MEEEEEEADWVEDVDETDETEDWRALASPARGERTRGEREESPMRFLRASDMLRELDLNDVDASESLRSPSEGSSRGTSVKKTLDANAAARAEEALDCGDRSRRNRDRNRRAGTSCSMKRRRWDARRSGFRECVGRNRCRRLDLARLRTAVLRVLDGRRRRRRRRIQPPARGAEARTIDFDDAVLSGAKAKRCGRGVVLSSAPTSPPNKRVIRNALRVLIGPPDREPYVDAVRAIDACEFPSVVILLKGSADVAPYKLRGVYAVVENTALKKIHGAGPPYLRSDEIVAALKYDTASMSFTTLPSPAITPTVAAISPDARAMMY